MKWRSFLLAVLFAFQATPAFGDCNGILLDQFFEGARIHGQPSSNYKLDDLTATDIELPRLEAKLNPYFYTELGRRRFHHTLYNPELDATRIQNRSEFIKYIAKNWDEFEGVRQFFKLMAKNEKDLLTKFQELAADSSDPKWEVLSAFYMWGAYAGAAVIHKFFPEHYIWAYSFLGSAFYSSVSNVRRMRSRLDEMLPYKARMEAIQETAWALRDIENPIANEIRQSLRLAHADRRMTWKERLQTTVETYTDRALDRGSRELPKIFRRLLNLEKDDPKIFGFKIPLGLNARSDIFYVSNFRLRSLRTLVVEHKEDLAAMLSTVSELEVCMGLADFYRQNEGKAILGDASDSPDTHVAIKNLHNPFIVTEKDSTPNDVLLGQHGGAGGNNPFALLVGNANQGTRSYQKAIALAMISIQANVPIFAEAANVSPSVMIANINPISGNGLRGQTTAEFDRLAQIIALHEQYPHTLVVLNEPFSGLADPIRFKTFAAVIHHLTLSETIGIVSSRSQNVLQSLEPRDDVALLSMVNNRIVPFKFTQLEEVLHPEVTYQLMEQAGVPRDLIDRIRSTDSQNPSGSRGSN